MDRRITLQGALLRRTTNPVDRSSKIAYGSQEPEIGAAETPKLGGASMFSVTSVMILLLTHHFTRIKSQPYCQIGT